MSKRKYRKGDPFQNVEELVRWINSGNWLYWRDVPKHFSIIQNMSFGMVIRAAGNGTILPAILNKEEP